MPTTRIEVNIPGETPYNVRVGEALLHNTGADCRKAGATAESPKAVVVTDSNVAPLYLTSVKDSLVQAGYETFDIAVEAGENAKSTDVIAELWNAFALLGITRDCFVVALGGGVVGDLAGFAAATFMRGLPVVQVPTTLLSMVDSSVGGKTGINLSAGKNMVGAFKQPSLVVASLDTLSTLPEREWACGCGEVAKSAVIDSDDFFFWLMDNARELRNRATPAIEEVVKRCVVFKAGVVAADKTESKGVRECLNYGHTLAHAIESLAGYGTFSHGAAVAEGMRFAAYLGERVVGTSREFADAQAQLLDELGLPSLDWVTAANDVLAAQAMRAGSGIEVGRAAEGGDIFPTLTAADVIACMKRDKKVRGGQLRFVLVRDVADWQLVNVADDAVAQALKEFYQL